MKSIRAEVIANKKYGENLYKLEIFSPHICKNALPGQFINIKCSGLNTYDPLLRRPFSIYDTEKNYNVFSIMFLVRGKGTEYLCKLDKGDFIDLLGPLGDGFKISASINNYVLIGGGIGVAPLCFIAKELIEKNKNVLFVAGFKDETFYGWQKDIVKILRNYRIFTEDGSFGENGIPFNFIKDNLKSLKKHRFVVCGPIDMLKNFQLLFKEKNVKAQAVIEEIIACGIGACMGCAVKIVKDDGSFEYKKVCSDGPVFNLAEVIFE